MLGTESRQEAPTSRAVTEEASIPNDHPLRAVREFLMELIADGGLESEELRSWAKQVSIEPKRLIPALLLEALYGIRGELLLMEQFRYNELFRCFIGLPRAEPVWEHSAFSRDRRCLLNKRGVRKILRSVIARARSAGLLDDERFSVDDTLIWRPDRISNGASDDVTPGGEPGVESEIVAVEGALAANPGKDHGGGGERCAHRECDPMIRVSNLTKKFGSVTAVDGISFSVARGEIFAFLGPNGAGKTTTIRMLTTLLGATSGAIELAGIDPVKRKHQARQNFGIVFQEPSLDQDLTVRENMEMNGILYRVPRGIRRKRIERLLRMFELWERRDSEVKVLSGGMRRRLEVARGMLHTPKVLFLDEPTIGLDPQSRYQLWNHITELNRTDGLTVFLTTHYMDEADRVSNRIAIIDHGRIISVGSPKEIKARSGRSTLEDAFLALTGSALRDG